jgi:transposase-like protein
MGMGVRPGALLDDDGNLPGMGRFISDETRRRLATGWDPHVSTLRKYATENGVSERAIRNWRARLRHESGISQPAGSAAVPLLAVVDALQARLRELEAAVEAAREAVAAAHSLLDSMSAETAGGVMLRTVVVEAMPPSASTPPEPTAMPMPIPRPGVFW